MVSAPRNPLDQFLSEYKINSILHHEAGKVKNAQNHREIDGRGEAEGSKPVV